MPEEKDNTGGKTNQLYRQKYFVQAGKVLFAGRTGSTRLSSGTLSRVIDGSVVEVARQPVVVHGGANQQIKVDTIREGNKVKALRITCPCGRHLEMDVEYEA